LSQYLLVATVDRQQSPVNCPINNLSIGNGHRSCHEECMRFLLSDGGPCLPILRNWIVKDTNERKSKPRAPVVVYDSGVNDLKRLLNIP